MALVKVTKASASAFAPPAPLLNPPFAAMAAIVASYAILVGPHKTASRMFTFAMLLNCWIAL